MKPHHKIYFDFFGITPGASFRCEICGRVATNHDIHHIERRGMGGRKGADVIENLMALCSYARGEESCHVKYGDKKKYKKMLKRIHEAFLELGVQ